MTHLVWGSIGHYVAACGARITSSNAAFIIKNTTCKRCIKKGRGF